MGGLLTQMASANKRERSDFPSDTLLSVCLMIDSPSWFNLRNQADIDDKSTYTTTTTTTATTTATYTAAATTTASKKIIS